MPTFARERDIVTRRRLSRDSRNIAS
jgi:hypothetical protein